MQNTPQNKVTTSSVNWRQARRRRCSKCKALLKHLASAFGVASSRQAPIRQGHRCVARAAGRSPASRLRTLVASAACDDVCSGVWLNGGLAKAICIHHIFYVVSANKWISMACICKISQPYSHAGLALSMVLAGRGKGYPGLQVRSWRSKRTENAQRSYRESRLFGRNPGEWWSGLEATKLLRLAREILAFSG
eukprot:1148842-Pelagomonas_calceolata.AAC.2